MAHHLGGADRIYIDKLLAATRITVLITHDGLVIAHGRESLIGYSPEIAALVEADLVLSRRLNHLRLIHNLANLLL